MKVLVVDDSRAMRSLLIRILAPFGAEFDQAGDGEEALARLLSAPPPDLALFDWNMPKMNGLQLLEAVRKDARFSMMKIVMVTTEVEMQNVSAAVHAGANDYLTKPFTEADVVERVAALGFRRRAA